MATSDTITSLPICPNSLSNPVQVVQLTVIHHTDAQHSYTHFLLTFRTPPHVTAARLTFEFQATYPTWLLDAVSVKTNDPSSIELLQDGDFENRNADKVWEYCYPGRPEYTPQFSPVACHSGSFCFQTRSQNRLKDYLAQRFDVQGDETYLVEFYVLSEDEDDVLTVTISFQ